MTLYSNPYSSVRTPHSAWGDEDAIGFQGMYCEACGYSTRHATEGILVHPIGLMLHSGKCTRVFFDQLPPEIDVAILKSLLANYGK